MATNRNVRITENTKYLKVSKISEIYGVSRYSIYNMVNRGEIPAIKLGNKILILKTDWDAYIEKSKIVPGTLDVDAMASAPDDTDEK